MCTKLSNTTAPSKKAFTLIELLVVIAIIAILAAILFPVFAQARDKARQITSLSNEKQMGLAFVQYLQDNDELYPETNIFNFGDPSETDWPAEILPYIKDLDVFRAPDDSGPANSDFASAGPWISYAVNGWQAQGAVDTPGGASNATNGLIALSDSWAAGAKPVPDSKVNYPSATILLTEAYSGDIALSSGGGNFTAGVYPNDWPDNVFLGDYFYGIGGPVGGEGYDDNIPNDLGTTPSMPWPSGATGSVSNHYAGTPRTTQALANFLFCDGHVQALHPQDTNPTTALPVPSVGLDPNPSTNMWDAMRQ